MGGVGAAVGGAKSTEEILFGMASGAMVGMLNHGLHLAENVFQKNLQSKYAKGDGETVDASKLKITYSNKEVKVDNTDAYTKRAALKYPDQVAAIAKGRYYEIYGTKLNISNSSLSNEIMYHAVAYEFHILRIHTNISNCGEGSLFTGDTNRLFWDFFSRY